MEINLKKDFDKLGELHDAMSNLVKGADLRGGNMDESENAKFDALNTEHTNLEASIERKKTVNGHTSKEEEKIEKIAERKNESVDEVKDFKEASRKAYQSYLRGGFDKMSTKEIEVMKRSQTAGTDSQGGYTVDESMSSSIIKTMAEFGGVRSVATILSTSTGGTLNYPTNNDSANVGEWLAEGSAASAQDTVFGNVALGAWKASSDYMLISRELIQDSAFNIEEYINGLIADRIGRLSNTAYTVGTGSSQPTGVVTSAGLGGTTDVTVVIDFDDCLNLKHSVDRAYRNNGKFMFNDNVLKALKKASIASANQSLWQPGIVGGAPATIDGDEYVVNNDMADVAIDSHSICYGDFSKFVIRDVTGIEVLRSDQLNILKNLITYVGFMRTDSALVDTSAVKYLRTLGT